MRNQKPKFDVWRLAQLSSALHIFQIIGSLSILGLISTVSLNFPPTYASFIICFFSSTLSAIFLVSEVCGLTKVREFSDEWVFWESTYISSFTFFYSINTITVLYSSIRWNHTNFWFASIVSILVAISFYVSLTQIARKNLENLKRSEIPKIVLRRN
ncbi:unnamed protein product [Caenorhabditis angaria]|uniref:MARVEL domain-containing protein n=1 Tax=Caenorhabditis angaria TaxID=860376 RepID=A0A9P1I5W8_9PELO|nr:unnamed protein product [Caenorhabditis angaria]